MFKNINSIKVPKYLKKPNWALKRSQSDTEFWRRLIEN